MMSTSCSALAKVLAQHTEDDVLHALQLYFSLSPHLRDPVLELLEQEPLKRYTGDILSFSQERNFGFIRSP
ncbi:unnamed protein product, partial [Polarella glacialis]